MTMEMGWNGYPSMLALSGLPLMDNLLSDMGDPLLDGFPGFSSGFENAVTSGIVDSLGWGLSLGGELAPTAPSSQSPTSSYPSPSSPSKTSPSSDATKDEKKEEPKEKNVPQDIHSRVKKAAQGKEGKLQSGGSDKDIKDTIEKGGERTTETVNNPDISTIKSKMSEEGVTGGVILIPGHAVAVKPGDDGSSAVHQQQSSSCWCYAAETAKTDSGKGNSKGSGDVTVYDSGSGTKSKLEQYAQKQKIEGLIVAKKKKSATT